MDKKIKSNLTNRVTIRFSKEEYIKLYTSFNETSKRKLSEYVRFVLLQKPVTVYTKNISQDKVLTELIHLKRELNAIGNNLNQSVKKLHTLETNAQGNRWLENFEKVVSNYLELSQEIYSKIAQISDQWSQE
jgi:5-bromo-4-chloroindolyl phosphate hydrolysis protein